MRKENRLPVAALGGGVLLAALLAATFHLPQQLLALVSPAHSPHRLDGKVGPGEYRFRWADDASKLVFQWSVVGDRLLGAVSSPDTGWVAVGFGGDGPLMYGADIVIGWVDAHGVHVRDDFANTPTGHVPDTTLGGHDDVLASAGLRSGAGTTIEFERALAAHDTTDRPIVPGRMHVIVASSESPDPMAYHMEGHKAVALLDLFAGPPAVAARSPLPDHLSDVQIMLAVWMAILLIVGVHGVLAGMAEGTEPGGPLARESVSMAVIAVLVVIEVGALGAFAAGVVGAWPVWLLGSVLAAGLLALAGIVTLYARAFVPWRSVQAERDDGVPW
jgi:hypothetical protein